MSPRGGKKKAVTQEGTKRDLRRERRRWKKKRPQREEINGGLGGEQEKNRRGKYKAWKI